jgi:protein-S-isoprenylcysteine O-methyltransferase Ste14
MMPLKNKFPPAFLFSTIVIMIALHLLLPGSQIIRAPWRYLGLIPFVLGNVLNALADQAFKQHETTVKPFAESTYLVTYGVFRLSRNPMYLGFVLILVGIAVLLGSLTPWIGVIVFPFLMQYRFIRIEETMLEARFGSTWLEYKQRVRRWF